MCIQIVRHVSAAAAATAKLLQSCPTLCNPIDGSLPGSSVPEILQARTLEWVTISFSNAWKWKVKVKSLSHVWLLATAWTTACQAPPSMGFSRQEYWSGVPLPSPLYGLQHLNFWFQAPCFHLPSILSHLVPKAKKVSHIDGGLKMFTIALNVPCIYSSLKVVHFFGIVPCRQDLSPDNFFFSFFLFFS